MSEEVTNQDTITAIEVPVFDYGALNEDHKAAAQEISEYLQTQGLTDVANALRLRFKLKEIPKVSIDDSPFVAACKAVGLYCAIQGYIQEGQEPNIVQYPLVALCDDIRKFELLVSAINSMELNENSK
jgi:hypothetical protein